LPEPLVAQLGDRELHLLDQKLPGSRFRFEIACLCLGRTLGRGRLSKRRLAGEHQRLQRRNVIGERIG
jgi:hypothetical protein